MSLHESYSSHVQRVGRKDVVKSSRIAIAMKEVEGKSALDGIQMLSGGFITESRAKCFEICSVGYTFLVQVATTEALSFLGIYVISQIPPEK